MCALQFLLISFYTQFYVVWKCNKLRATLYINYSFNILKNSTADCKQNIFYYYCHFNREH